MTTARPVGETRARTELVSHIPPWSLSACHQYCPADTNPSLSPMLVTCWSLDRPSSGPGMGHILVSPPILPCSRIYFLGEAVRRSPASLCGRPRRTLHVRFPLVTPVDHLPLSSVFPRPSLTYGGAFSVSSCSLGLRV